MYKIDIIVNMSSVVSGTCMRMGKNYYNSLSRLIIWQQKMSIVIPYQIENNKN